MVNVFTVVQGLADGTGVSQMNSVVVSWLCGCQDVWLYASHSAILCLCSLTQGVWPWLAFLLTIRLNNAYEKALKIIIDTEILFK